MSARLLIVIKDTALVERYGVMMLSAVLKRAGHTVDLVRAQRYSLRELTSRVEAFQPAALLYSAMTGEHRYLLDINRYLRQSYRGLSVFGGPHVTFFPETVFEPGVDAVCVGEGEGAVVDLASALAAGDDYTRIPNLWVKQEDAVIRNDLRPLIARLDELPFADREILYREDRDLRDDPVRLFFGMRGCVYRCTYCFNHRYNDLYRDKGPVLRTRSVESLLTEMRLVKERWPLRYMQIDDDTFLLHDREWLAEFAERLPREIGVPFMCNVRVDLLDEEMVRLLKAAECRAVWMGIETGNEDTRRTLLRRHHTNHDIVAAVRLLHRHDIRVAAQNLCGLPVEDPVTTDLETLRLNMECRPDFAWSSIFYPYPRTELGERAIQAGYFDGSLTDAPETNKITSLLEWGDERVKRRVENLHKVFGIAVESPRLWPVLRRLIETRRNRFLVLLYFLWYGYCWKTRMERVRLSPRMVYSLFRTLVRYLRGIQELSPCARSEPRPI
jgi:anaerobic magnesium-protoporphyrin IX monomethyl ester cyclase